MDNESIQDPFAGLTIDDKRELLLILQQKRNMNTGNLPDNTPANPSPNKPLPTAPTVINKSTLPKWSGEVEDFSFYIKRLEARIEREWAPYADPCSICLDMIDTLPDDKRSRVAAWFDDSSSKNYFSWQDLAKHFRSQFDNKEARQAASEYVNRMEQGQNQLFRDFLKDFEYRMAPCREAYTQLGKSIQLKSSLNSRLRQALVGVKLPPLENYSAWVEGVAEVATDLEGLSNYRSKHAKQTSTKLGVPKGITVPEERISNFDEDGDTKMGENNALLAAIHKLESMVAERGNETSRGKEREKKPGEKGRMKPRASWLTEKEYQKMVKKGKCTRCQSPGHKSRYCTKFGPPIRPDALIGAVNDEEDSDSDSGKEEP